MAFVRTRTFSKNGRTYSYRYREERWREGGKVRSRSTLIGKVVKGVADTAAGALQFSLLLLLRRANGYVEPTSRPTRVGTVEKSYPLSVHNAKQRLLNSTYGVDITSRETFNNTRSRMNQTVYSEYVREQLKVSGEYHREMERQREAKSPTKVDAELSRDLRDFQKFVDASKADKGKESEPGDVPEGDQ